MVLHISRVCTQIVRRRVRVSSLPRLGTSLGRHNWRMADFSHPNNDQRIGLGFSKLSTPRPLQKTSMRAFGCTNNTVATTRLRHLHKE